MEELKWFAGKKMKAEGKLGCNALIERMHSAFLEYVKGSSPFEEIGSGPGQWYVRRFDKETVPGWWETEPGPGDPQGGMIPGPHDRVYHGLEQNTKGEWKKEADGKGGFRWVRLVCAI